MDWVSEIKSNHSTIGHWSGSFAIYESESTGACVASSGAPFYFGPVHTSTLELAKNACEDFMKTMEKRHGVGAET